MNIITIESKLKLISGLHIGGADDAMKIGGVDSPVIKREVFCNEKGIVGFGKEYNKKITEPYIPGSSIKGALQTVLNLSENESRALKISDSIGLDVKNRIAWSIRKAKKTDNDKKSKKIYRLPPF